MPDATLMGAEIRSQPDAMAQLLDRAPRTVAPIVERLLADPPRLVLFAGRGSSAHAGVYGRYLWSALLNVPCAELTLSALSWYSSRPDLQGVLVVAISQSGSSPDLLEAVSIARRCGATVLAISNDGASALMSAADLGIDIECGPEIAVAATKSYTNSLLALWLIADGIRGGVAAAAAGLADAASRQLAHAGAVDAVAGELAAADRIMVTGRGLSLATAHEASLKITETCLISGLAFGAADLMHGPIAMIEPGFPVITVESHGLSDGYMNETIRALVDRQARLIALGHQGAGAASIPSDRGVGWELLPLTEIIPLQLLALSMSRRRGIDVDRPGGLSKVTLTR